MQLLNGVPNSLQQPHYSLAPTSFAGGVAASFTARLLSAGGNWWCSVTKLYLTGARMRSQMAALSKAVTPLKRVLPLRMNLLKGLVRGRLAHGGGMKPATASAFVDGPGT